MSLFLNVPALRAALIALALTVLPLGVVAAPLAPDAPASAVQGFGAAAVQHPAKAPVSSATLSPDVMQKLQAQIQAAQFAQHPQTALQQRAPWLTHIFAGLFVIFAVSLVVLLAFQTTKQEGLSGTIGGRVESTYRPRLGFDQQLARLTTFVAVGFGVMATIVSLSGI